MARQTKASSGVNAGNGSKLDFEAKLWQTADALRNNMDAAEYKHVVLGLIFLKYISDAFEAKHAELVAEKKKGADPEDPDEYRAVSIFWVPKEARWQHLKASAPQPTIGKLVDDAMTAIERDNPSLKGVLPKDYARPGLDKQRLGQLINLVSDIGLGKPEDRAKDTLGRVYEYFLSQFASAEGKKGGQFYTPSRVVRVLVEILAPYKGRVYDPCCGSGGMFVSSEKFIEAHSGKIGDISIYGQESNYTTWRLAKMNLAIRGIDAQIGHGDTFHKDAHPDLRADYVLANPPFNDSDWRGELLKDDKRWVYGMPPAGNANFAWVQHFIHHLAPTGLAGFVLANGSMSSNQSGEGEIRKAIVEADLVDCMVALPGQLFYSTQIPVCLWFLARNKKNGRFRDRRGETLFIDARKMGTLVDRVHRELTDEDTAKIAGTYHAWRGDKDAGKYADVPGFCMAAKLEDIRKHGHVLTPGRYVGAEDVEDNGEPFEEKMKRLTATLREQQAEGVTMDAAIAANLKGLGIVGEWFERTTFADLIVEGALEIGDGYRAKNEELGGDGLIFLRAGHVTDTHIDFNGVERFHAELEPRVRSKLAKPGDAVVTTKGNSTGRTTFVSHSMPPFVYSPHLSYWRSQAPTRIEGGFLRYWSKGPEFAEQLAGMKASTDMAPYLSLVDQKRLRISLPPIAEQRAIAHILGTLDDKIELNRRMNEALEAMARALFKSWFVDFDPVCAKAEGRDPGLPKPLADLFPARLVDSELGEIPEAWEVKSLGDLVEMVKGRSYTSEELAESDTALVTLKSFARGGGYRPDGLKSFTGTYKPDQVVKPGELVIACTDVTQAAEVIGRPAIVRGAGGYRTLVASLDTLIVRPSRKGMTRAFLYFLGGTEAFVAHTYAHTTGTTVLHLAKQAVPTFRFARPPERLVESFDSLASLALARIQASEQESDTLAALRDTLLPKLISGELRVKDVEGIAASDSQSTHYRHQSKPPVSH